METGKNRRGYEESFFKSRHLRLNDLKEKARGLGNQYLFKDNIPEYPHPEFVVSHVRHDTDGKGLGGISEDNGFKAPFQDPSSGLGLLWWSLSVGPDEIKSAERRLLEKTYPKHVEQQEKPLPDQMEEQQEKPLPDQMEEGEKPLPDQKQQGFLEKFTTSAAFLKSSRLGSYRFTFPLKDLLEVYREQFCSGSPPVMRVFKTILYKKTVNYVVLVHSPDQEQFSDYPLLTDNPDAVCTYRDGCFIWRPEAMSETHGYELIEGPDQMEVKELFGYDVQFYVWDYISIALHVEDKVLNFDTGRLRDNLKFCSEGYPALPGVIFEDFQTAEKLVNKLWPDHPSPLEKDE
ncbi:uncharacterized protein LOC116065171 isoform X2 [Sander lucioperca]|uniref:uncharacterized protein LOC116065171 isoform X2 n=1 Tax=Sander lucioperca TaxID=283035 RepID=UPI00125D2757|nr:uncharacterized protein LOC116065171 isoform X2 [Sander lucioperca]